MRLKQTSTMEPLNPKKTTKKKAIKASPPASLRKRAESRLAKQKERLRELSATDLTELVHELGTHQIELEMQNEELRAAQHALEASRARYADLYDFSPLGYFSFDKNGVIREVNLTGAAMLGITKQLLLDKRMPVFIDPADRAVFRDHLLEVFRTQTRASCEIRLLKKDGTFFDAELFSIFFGAGEGTGLCHTAISDVTERKRAEKALHRAKNLSDALNRINKAVHSTFDVNEIMRRVMTEAKKAMGCDSAAISMREDEGWFVRYADGFSVDPVGRRMSDEQEPHAVLALKMKKPVVINDTFHDQALNAEHMKAYGVRSVLVVPLIAGEKPLGVMFFNHHGAAVPFSDDQVDFADKLASTISLALTNLNLFEERNRARYELEAANFELDAFSQSVSHDLREPLRSIEGFSTAILEDCAPTLDETGKDYFNRIAAASRRMSQLIEAMLTMSRLTKGELRHELVNLSALAEVIAYELGKRQPERQVRFVIAPMVKVLGDTSMLRIVLENLLSNAWKFTSRHPFAKIEFGALPVEGRTVYFVRDDGVGFSREFSDKLFKPFKRLHSESEFPGLGIGLAIAYRIINRHGGRIWAEGEVEKGATVYFTL